MKSPHPPASATWLLDHAHVDEALAGDLAEEYCNRRSPSWYWRQTVAAALVTSANTMVRHKWLAARAIFTGWLMWAIFATILRESQDWLQSVDPGAAATLTASASVLRYSMWLVIGWIIGRLHRPHQTAMVLAYVLFTLMMSLPAVGRAVDLLGHPPYAPPSLATVALAVVSLIAGGLLSAPSHRPARRVHGAGPA